MVLVYSIGLAIDLEGVWWMVVAIMLVTDRSRELVFAWLREQLIQLLISFIIVVDKYELVAAASNF